MAILYYDDKKLFQLNTEKTTYVIGLSPEGYVGHVYYGPLLHGEPDLYPLRMDEPPFTPSVNKREKSSFLDRFPMEYPTGGIGDYRESCLNVRNAQGRMGCEIHFDSYEIFKGKRKMEGLPASFGTEEEVETLEITCKDPILGLVVVLSYSVFEKENVITRSVCVKNEGSETLKVEKIYSACLDMDNEDFEMLSLHGSWGRERHIQQGALRYGKQLVSSGKGESSHQEHPFVALVTPGTDQQRGEVYAMHFEYSGNFIGQLESMIMQKTDYSVPDSTGILMTFKYDDVSLMDFNRFDELHDIGYERTMELMDSIKNRIPRRMDYRLLEKERMAFKKKMPEFRFRNIIIHGANDQQKKYIRKEFHSEEDGTFSLEELRKGYFRLMSSDNMISEIIPHAVYNPYENDFNLDLKVRMKDDLSLRVGGNVGSNGANQVYVGATYHNLNNFSKEFSLDGQLGQIYNNLQLAGRIDLPTRLPTSYRLVASLSTFDYLKQEKLLSKGNTPIFNKQKEEFVKLFVSMPFLSRQKAEFGIGVGQLEDQYFQTNVIDFTSDVRDVSKYSIFGGSVALDGNTLNSRQFATSGRRERLAAHIYTGVERYYPGNEDPAYTENYKYIQSWLQIAYELEKYHTLSPHFSLGTYLKAYYSSRNFSHNYRATMMQAGEFAPTAHSRITYNEAFRANQFVGAGVCPIYMFNSVLQVRLGMYGFAPIFPIREESNKASYGKVFSQFEYMGELDLVVKLPFGSICAYLNHYSSPSKNWNLGLTLGWQIFGSRFME